MGGEPGQAGLGQRWADIGPRHRNWRVKTRETKGCLSFLYLCSLFLPRLVSSVQAVMASTAGYIVSTSCKHVIDDQ